MAHSGFSSLPFHPLFAASCARIGQHDQVSFRQTDSSGLREFRCDSRR